MSDPTEDARRAMVEEINNQPKDRPQLEKEYGQVWSTEELGKDFTVLGFMAPFVMAVRKTDYKKGSLMFQHSPRFYYNWQVD
jgi:hypothetical protein